MGTGTLPMVRSLLMIPPGQRSPCERRSAALASHEGRIHRERFNVCHADEAVVFGAVSVEVTMSNTREETIATLALLNLIRLMAAELVAGEHRKDVERLIRAMDQKLDATPIPEGTDENAARAGIAHAKALLRPYVKHVRDQAKVAQIRDAPVTLRLSKYLQ